MVQGFVLIAPAVTGVGSTIAAGGALFGGAEFAVAVGLALGPIGLALAAATVAAVAIDVGLYLRRDEEDSMVSLRNGYVAAYKDEFNCELDKPAEAEAQGEEDAAVGSSGSLTVKELTRFTAAVGDALAAATAK
jgi:hypothetical protein